MLRNIFRDNKGSATFLAVIVTIVLTTLGLGIAMMTAQSTKVSGDYSDRLAAQNAAEAGAQRAIYALSGLSPLEHCPKTYVSEDTNYLVTYRYDAELDTYKSNKVYIVTSIGEVWASNTSTKPRTTRQIIATIRFDPLPGSSLKGTLDINGPITEKTSADSIVVDNLAALHGTNWWNNKGKNETHHITEGTMDFPAYPYDNNFSEFKTGEKISVNKIEGTVRLLDKESYYVDGPLTIESGLKATTPTTIYVNGTVKADSSAKIDGNITIVAYGEININSNTAINKGTENTFSLYASGKITVDPAVGGKLFVQGQGDVTINGDADNKAVIISGGKAIINADVVGAVYAQGGFLLNGGGSLTVDSSVVKGGSNLRIVKWSYADS